MLMDHLFFFGELGYLINCILPQADQLNDKVTIHCFEDYKFILSQYCKTNFKTINFYSSIKRGSANGHNDKEYLSTLKFKYPPRNLNIIANPNSLFIFNNYKNIPYPISSKPIEMNNKSILFNFRNRKNSTYGNLSKEFYEDLIKYFGDYHIYNCGNIKEIHKIDIEDTSYVNFQDIPYIAQNCECCILTDSGLTSMVIKCNPKKVVILFQNSKHMDEKNNKGIYLKNIANFDTPTQMYLVENNKLNEEDLLDLIDFVNY
jgi:hypothetical protein